jgi:outer membrane biosynthesis protein TonB
MLPERYLQLLTAYLDGELSPQEQVVLHRLLRRSRRARLLLRQLQHDAQLLRSLPVPVLPVDLSTPVLQAIAERGLSPAAAASVLPPESVAVPATPSSFRPASAAPSPDQERDSVPDWLAVGPALLPDANSSGSARRRRVRSVPTWLGVPLAAAVLLAVALGSFWFFWYLGTLRTPHNATPLAQRPPALPTPRHLGLPSNKEKPPTRDPVPKDSRPPVVTPPEKKEPPPPPKDEPPPPPQVQHLSLARLADPAETIEKDRLLQHLHPDRAYHVRLAYRDGAQALDGLRSALRAQGIALLTTPATEQGMQQKKNKKNKYLLYIDNVQPQELLAMLRSLGQQGQGMHGPIWQDHLAVELLTAERMQQLLRPLGMKPEQLQMPPAKPAPPPTTRSQEPPSLEVLLLAKEKPAATSKSSAPSQSPGKTSAQTTAKSKEKAVSGKKASSPAAAPAAERQALLLAVADNGPHSRAIIEDFLRRRRPARPGTLCVIIQLDT